MKKKSCLANPPPHPSPNKKKIAFLQAITRTCLVYHVDDLGYPRTVHESNSPTRCTDNPTATLQKFFLLYKFGTRPTTDCAKLQQQGVKCSGISFKKIPHHPESNLRFFRIFQFHLSLTPSKNTIFVLVNQFIRSD